MKARRILAGAPLVQLHNAALESKLARSRTDSEVANARAANSPSCTMPISVQQLRIGSGWLGKRMSLLSEVSKL